MYIGFLKKKIQLFVLVGSLHVGLILKEKFVRFSAGNRNGRFLVAGGSQVMMAYKVH